MLNLNKPNDEFHSTFPQQNADSMNRTQTPVGNDSMPKSSRIGGGKSCKRDFFLKK